MVTRDLDGLSRRLTRQGAAATSLPSILLAEISILQYSRCFNQLYTNSQGSFRNVLEHFREFQHSCILYEFLSMLLKSNTCFQIYDNASPCIELHWLSLR